MVTFSSIALFAMVGLASDFELGLFSETQEHSRPQTRTLGAVRSIYRCCWRGDNHLWSKHIRQQPTRLPATVSNPPVNGIDVACLTTLRQNGYNAASGSQKGYCFRGHQVAGVTRPQQGRFRYGTGYQCDDEFMPQIWSAMPVVSLLCVLRRAQPGCDRDGIDGNLILLIGKMMPPALVTTELTSTAKIWSYKPTTTRASTLCRRMAF